MTLELSPNTDLVFKGPFTTVSTTSLKLSNSGNERLAYKIKTTAPKRYCVKPNSGFLNRNETANVQVMLQPLAPGTQDDRNKHKFMVQWAVIPSTYEDDVENFWKHDAPKFAVQDSKLKCVFADGDGSAAPADGGSNVSSTRSTDFNTVAPQQGGSTHKVDTAAPRANVNATRDSNPVQNISQDRSQDAGDDATKSRLKSELDYLRKENGNLKEKLNNTELRQRNATIERIDNPVTDRSKSSYPPGSKGLLLFGIPLNEQSVLVAFVFALLFGFSLGYFLFSCGNDEK